MENLKSHPAVWVTLLFINSCVNLECEDSSKTTTLSPSLEAKQLSVGAGQGVQVIDDFVYVFGDDGAGGIVMELDRDFEPTGWTGALTSLGDTPIPHPTGIAYHEGMPTFVGGLEGQRARIHQIDWSLFRNDGNLDEALLRTIEDEEARNGTRPEYVSYQGRWYVATADYDAEEGNEIRLMDPDLLMQAVSTSDEGVVVHRFPAGRYIQSLRWNDEEGELILVQNIRYVKGWRLGFVDLNQAVTSGSAEDNALLHSFCIPNASELEGYYAFPDGREVFVTASTGFNLFIGSGIAGGIQ